MFVQSVASRPSSSATSASSFATLASTFSSSLLGRGFGFSRGGGGSPARLGGGRARCPGRFGRGRRGLALTHEIRPGTVERAEALILDDEQALGHGVEDRPV